MEEKKENEKKSEDVKNSPKKEEESKKEEKKETEEPKNINKKKEVEILYKTEVPKDLEMKNIVEDKNLLSTAQTWDELGIKPEIIKGLLEMKFTEPSKIQATTFPLIMKEPRTNVIAQAKNGSGKTAAFGLGVISSIDESSSEIQAVVFAHTRELVLQIKNVLSQIAKFTKVKVTSLLSGENETDVGQIIVITPGHFENCYLKRNKEKLKNLKMLVLDEADFMLTNEVTSKVCDRSFKLFQKEKINVQILFFSATFDVKCFIFIKRYYKNAFMIELKKEELTLDNVSQLYQECKGEEEKVEFIENYLKVSKGSQRVIIFANKRDYVVKLQENLFKRGYKVYILMGGDMALQNRDETIRKFKDGEIQILITTDLLARGYDEKSVKLVINFDLPVKKTNKGKFEPDFETYLHRIGRTGRFGSKGIGLNLCKGKNDMEILHKIEEYYKTKIEKLKTLDELSEDLKKIDL